jgi:acyl carrier protein
MMNIDPEIFLKDLKAEIDLFAVAQKDTSLDALPGWDSLAILLVLSFFEEKYGVSVSGQQVRACRTVADLYSLAFPARS